MKHLLLMALMAVAVTSGAQTPATLSWQSQPSLIPGGYGAQMAGAVGFGRYGYIIGGNNGIDGDTNRTFKLTLNPTFGSAQQVDAATTLPANMNSNVGYLENVTVITTATTAPTIYECGGGYNAGGPNYNKIRIGKLDSNGNITTWTESAAFPGAQGNASYDPELGAAVIAQNNCVYMMGGDSQSGTPPAYSTIVWGKLNADSSIGTFTTATTPVSMYFPAAVSIGNYLIVHPGIVGGLSRTQATADVYVVPVDPTTGAPGTWVKQTGAALPDIRYGMAMVAVGNTVFAIAGRRDVSGTATGFNTVWRATFNTSTGTLGAWQSIDAGLPAGTWYHQAWYSSVTDRIYIGSVRTAAGITNELLFTNRLFAVPTAAGSEWSLYQ